MMIDDLAVLSILRVARAELPAGQDHGLWPCGFCATDYPVHDGWLVDYYHAPTRETARSYICGNCAANAMDHRDRAQAGN